MISFQNIKQFYERHQLIVIIILVAGLVVITTTAQYYISINDGSAFNYCVWNFKTINGTITQDQIRWCEGLKS